MVWGIREVPLTTETKQDKDGKPVVKVTNISSWIQPEC